MEKVHVIDEEVHIIVEQVLIADEDATPTNIEAMTCAFTEASIHTYEVFSR